MADINAAFEGADIVLSLNIGTKQARMLFGFWLPKEGPDGYQSFHKTAMVANTSEAETEYVEYVKKSTPASPDIYSASVVRGVQYVTDLTTFVVSFVRPAVQEFLSQRRAELGAFDA